MRRLQADLERMASGIAALRIVHALIALRGSQMGKLTAVAERIAATKKRLDDEADKLATRLDKIDVDAPAAFDKGHRFLEAQQAEVRAIEDTLRQLSNLPLDESTASPPPLEPPPFRPPGTQGGGA